MNFNLRFDPEEFIGNEEYVRSFWITDYDLEDFEWDEYIVMDKEVL